jgi:hypothetical protein
MDLKGYNVSADIEHISYEFLSIGIKSTIKKDVSFKSLGLNIYFLAFGDKNELTGEIDDRVNSNNGDRDKVLATVAEITLDFLAHHRDATVIAVGSTPGRSRLYQMGINSKWHLIRQFYWVEGYINDDWEDYQPGKNYEAFSMRLKLDD